MAFQSHGTGSCSEEYIKNLFSPQNRAMLSEFSAVCFLYGRVLYDHLKVHFVLFSSVGKSMPKWSVQVPIGLIESSWGGTSIETWMPDEAIENCGLNKLPDYVSLLWSYKDLSLSVSFRAKAFRMRKVNAGTQ